MLLHSLLAFALLTGPAHRSVASDTTIAHKNGSAKETARRHTTFGVAIAPVPDAIRAMPYLESDEGVVLAQVQPRSAAEAAGLRKGDLVLRIDGRRVDETTIFAAIRETPRNKPFRVEFLRNNGWRDTWVTIDQRGRGAGPRRGPAPSAVHPILT